MTVTMHRNSIKRADAEIEIKTKWLFIKATGVSSTLQRSAFDRLQLNQTDVNWNMELCIGSINLKFFFGFVVKILFGLVLITD